MTITLHYRRVRGLVTSFTKTPMPTRLVKTSANRLSTNIGEETLIACRQGDATLNENTCFACQQWLMNRAISCYNAKR